MNSQAVSWRGKAVRCLPVVAALTSGVLLATAFPPLEWDGVAWFALAPLIVACTRVDAARGFRLGTWCGLVFWLATLQWLTHVTYAGWMVLAGYCALYMGAFGALTAWTGGRWAGKGAPAHIALMLFYAACWMALECMRSVFCTGFPWNTLGVSQYQNLTVSQIASWGGVYAVSGLVLWVNAGIAFTILSYLHTGKVSRARRWHPELMIALLCWALAHAYGFRLLLREEPPAEAMRVALIQPNIPQTEKWTADRVQSIYDRLESLSSAAGHVGDVDLIVWPETALPDDVRTSPGSYQVVYRVATNGTPVLVGSMDTAWLDGGERRYYNSSFLFDTNGSIVAGYDKQHLVLFGEYVPLDEYLPFMKAMTPISASFSKGSTGTVFRLPEKEGFAFSVLICFEDTMARLARKAVRNGARLLVNQTNDAWFDVSSGSRQHMIHCVFRCIENRVAAVRATNTGISCRIDRYGRVMDVLDDGQGQHLVAGFKVVSPALRPVDEEQTFYTRYGDIWAWSMLLFSIAAAGLVAITERRSKGLRTTQPD